MNQQLFKTKDMKKDRKMYIKIITVKYYHHHHLCKSCAGARENQQNTDKFIMCKLKK